MNEKLTSLYESKFHWIENEFAAAVESLSGEMDISEEEAIELLVTYAKSI